MQIDPFGRLAAKVVRCDRLVAVCRNCGMDLAKYHRRFISLSFIYIVLTIITLAIAVKKKNGSQQILFCVVVAFIDQTKRKWKAKFK